MLPNSVAVKLPERKCKSDLLGEIGGGNYASGR